MNEETVSAYSGVYLMKKTSSSSSRAAGTAQNLLQQFQGMVQPSEQPKGKKPTKWELPLTPEAAEDAQRWANGKALLELVDARVENSKREFNEYAVKIMAEKIFANKSKPSNPLVLLKEGGDTCHQFQFTMMDKFKYNFQNCPDGIEPRDHYINQFVQVGLHPSDAEKLVDNEIDFSPIQGFRPLNELLEGYYGEKREWIEADEATQEAGRKFIKLVMWDGNPKNQPEALTPEEKQLVTHFRSDVNVRAGFYDRVASYCQNIDQLMGVFKLIQPIVYPSYLKFAMADSEAEKSKRLVAVAKEIVG
jgi:hypothetical protein